MHGPVHRPKPSRPVRFRRIRIFYANLQWGFHEVTAPFADFQVVFQVPGGSPALTDTITVHYEGAPLGSGPFRCTVTTENT